VLGAPALLLLLLVALAAMVARRVLRPLARLQSAVTAMQGGDLSVRCGSTAADELGDAARAVDVMALTLQKRDAALRESEGRLRLVMDNVPALIGYVDRQRRYALVNQSYLTWHGRPEHEVVGAAMTDFYDPAVSAQLAPQLDRAFAGERVHFELDIERRGQRYALAVTFVPQTDEFGEVHGVYTMKADVSELKRAERQLRAAFEENARLRDELERERDYLREEVQISMNYGRIIGESPALKQMLARLEAVAQTSASVLIEGESGVGKELVAHVIHARSPRAKGPLVKVNCASIPHELFESEFFGHVKGAFTGAVRDRVGRFELADGGTFFSMRVPRSDDVAGQALAGAASPRPPRSGPAGHVQLGL